MTWSIIAKDNATGQIGIAVATKFFAVGALLWRLAMRQQGENFCSDGEAPVARLDSDHLAVELDEPLVAEKVFGDNCHRGLSIRTEF